MFCCGSGERPGTRREWQGDTRFDKRSGMRAGREERKTGVKTNWRGGRYLSLRDPGHLIPDLVTGKGSFPGPRVNGRAAILREPSTTVPEVIATVTAHSLSGKRQFHFLTTGGRYR